MAEEAKIKEPVIIHIEEGVDDESKGKKGGSLYLKGGNKPDDFIIALVGAMQVSKPLRLIIQHAAFVTQVAEKRGWDMVKNPEIYKNEEAEKEYKALLKKDEK